MCVGVCLVKLGLVRVRLFLEWPLGPHGKGFEHYSKLFFLPGKIRKGVGGIATDSGSVTFPKYLRPFSTSCMI